jgi:very-short-patch-repair endonuclease
MPNAIFGCGYGGRELAAAKFRRQYSIGPYIVDFCCIDQRLVIELDGGQHLENVDADRERTAFLERLGFRVMRFWDNQVLTNTDAVLEAILEQLRPNSTARHP